MTNNCLKTQLKSSIANDNLVKMGELKIKSIKFSGASVPVSALFLKGIEDIPVRVTGNGYFSLTQEGLSDPSSCYYPGDDFSVPANTENHLYFPNETFDIFIGNKYAITYFILNGGTEQNKTLSNNIEDLKYSTTLEYLATAVLSYGDVGFLSSFVNLRAVTIGMSDNVFGTLDLHLSTIIGEINISPNSVIGDLTNFAGPNVSRLAISASGISGTFDSLGSAKKLTVFYAPTNISGTIEGFVNGQVTGTGARTSYNGTTLNCPSLDKVTFGGNYHEPLNIHFINWDYTSSNEKIYIHNGINGVSNATKVYCKGYTQQEAEAAFPNKTIIRVDAE